MDNDPPKVQEINHKRIEILTKRMEKFQKIRENHQVIDAQCSAIEDVLQLVRDQSVTMRDPQQISDQLENLVQDVEQTEQTVQQVEAIFEMAHAGRWMASDARLAVISDAPAPLRATTRIGIEPMPHHYQRRYSTHCPIGRGSSPKNTTRALTLMFVLHGNVRDLVPFRQPGGDRISSRCTSSSPAALFGRRDLVLHYDRGGGLSFGNADMQADFRTRPRGYDSFHGTNFSQGLPRNPDGVLNMLDNYLRLRIADGKKIALIIDFAETIAPAGDVSGMSAEDRNALVILKRWAQNPDFLAPTSRSA